MAFDFLGSTGSWTNPDTGQNVPITSGIGGAPGLQNILNLIGQGAATANTFKGYQPTSAEGAQGQAMSNQTALINAYLDPNSTIFKNLLSGNQQYLNSQTQQGINNLLQQNRRSQLMGRGSVFNPERQDEAISQYLSRQSDANANTARSNALKQIIDAAGQYGTSASNYGRMIPQQQQAQTQNREALPNGLSQIGQMLPGLLKAGTAIAAFL